MRDEEAEERLEIPSVPKLLKLRHHRSGSVVSLKTEPTPKPVLGGPILTLHRGLKGTDKGAPLGGPILTLNRKRNP